MPGRGERWPLVDFSEEVELVLRQAGWRPGVNRRVPSSPARSPNRWLAYAAAYTEPCPVSEGEGRFKRALWEHPARRVVEELYSLKTSTPHRDQQTSTLIFKPDGLCPAAEVRELGRLLGMRFVPIGEMLSEAYMLMADDSSLFFLGREDPGVYRAGCCLATSLETIFHDELIRPVWFAEGVMDGLRQKGLKADDPRGWHPPVVPR